LDPPTRGSANGTALKRCWGKKKETWGFCTKGPTRQTRFGSRGGMLVNGKLRGTNGGLGKKKASGISRGGNLVPGGSGGKEP